MRIRPSFKNLATLWATCSLGGLIFTWRAYRAANAPEAVAYFCDPVLGDGGRLYVPEALVEIYRDEVVPLATVRTPP